MKKIALLFAAASFLMACKDDPCFKSKGPVVEETRPLADSIAILEVRDNLNVEVFFAERNYMEVEGGENLVSFVEHSMESYRLILENKNSCEFLRGLDDDIKVRLYLKDIQEVDFYSTGTTIFRDPITTREFEFHGDGASGTAILLFDNYRSNIAIEGGNMNLSCFGKTRLLSVYTSGSSQVTCQNLEVVYCGVINDSSADALVQVSDSLEVQIETFADIIVYGDPYVEVLKRTGSGKVIKR